MMLLYALVFVLVILVSLLLVARAAVASWRSHQRRW